MSYLISPVEWDSRFFGFSIGRINLYPDFSLERLDETVQQGQRNFRLLYLFFKENGPDSLDGLPAPCPCFERKTVFHKEVSKNPGKINPHIRLHSELTSKRIETLAVLSGRFSRFHNDPQILPFYEQLFLTWISNSVQGDTADAIWTWEAENGKPVGLATVRCVKVTELNREMVDREGRIGMLAVDEKHHNHEVVASLLRACEYWAVSVNLKRTSLVVPTSHAELCSLCHNEGYTPDAEISVYHYWSPHWKYNPHSGWNYER